MRSCRALLELLFALSLLRPAWQLGKSSGPYDVIVQQVMTCSDDHVNDLNLTLHAYFKKIDGVKTLLYRGNISSPFNKTQREAIVVHADIFQRKTNDYLLMYKYEENLCLVIAVMANYVYNDLCNKIGVETGGCWFDPGDYTFTDWNIQVKLPFPMLEYGIYKSLLTLLLDQKEVMCVEIIANIKQKY